MAEPFGYPHFNTSDGERKTATAQFNGIKLNAELEKIRDDAFSREIPVSCDETLQFLTTLVCALRPKRILEIGTAVGVSAAAMSLFSPDAEITTVEKNAQFFEEAQKNFEKLNMSRKIHAILGDAAEIIGGLCGQFDFIFLDGAKAQYIKYLPTLKKLLTSGGALVADDVLLFGYITDGVPKKRKMLAEHIREYINAVTHDDALQTVILDIGDGVALSVKR